MLDFTFLLNDAKEEDKEDLVVLAAGYHELGHSPDAAVRLAVRDLATYQLDKRESEKVDRDARKVKDPEFTVWDYWSGAIIE